MCTNHICATCILQQTVYHAILNSCKTATTLDVTVKYHLHVRAFDYTALVASGKVDIPFTGLTTFCTSVRWLSFLQLTVLSRSAVVITIFDVTVKLYLHVRALDYTTVIVNGKVEISLTGLNTPVCWLSLLQLVFLSRSAILV